MSSSQRGPSRGAGEAPCFVVSVANCEGLDQGGAFVAGVALETMALCEIELTNGTASLVVAARCVAQTPQGIGVAFEQFDAAMKRRIAELKRGAAADTVAGADTGAFAGAATGAGAGAATGADTDTVAGADTGAGAATVADPDPDDASFERKQTVQERLRNLPVIEQTKLALRGDLAERVALERLYGKAVWEPLLRNPRVTPPEIARISRMGTLPRTQLETIVNNAAWLQSPEVRRALLSNPRLSSEQVPKILRLLPKHELRLVPTTMTFAAIVREQAKKMLKEG